MAYTSVTALWSGFTGGPGYTRLKFAGNLSGPAATNCADRMRTFFQALITYLPAGCVVSFSEAAQQFDTTGLLIAEVPISPVPGSITGTGAGAYAGGSGAVINWLTGSVLNGRKVRGRTFLVPLTGAFFTDGTLAGAAITAITTAATTLQGGSPGLVVASGLVPGTSGSSAGVTGVSVPDRAAVLRSRRD